MRSPSHIRSLMWEGQCKKRIRSPGASITRGEVLLWCSWDGMSDRLVFDWVIGILAHKISTRTQVSSYKKSCSFDQLMHCMARSSTPAVQKNTTYHGDEWGEMRPKNRMNLGSNRNSCNPSCWSAHSFRVRTVKHFISIHL
jgi:hypothetical protein